MINKKNCVNIHAEYSINNISPMRKVEIACMWATVQEA
jgi:hypothetical protein